MHPAPEKPTVVLVANMARTVSKHRLPLVRAMRAAGLRVVVAAPFDEFVGALLEASGAEFVALQQYKRNSTSPWQELRTILELRQLFRSYQPEIVLPFGIQSVILCNLAIAGTRIQSLSVITGMGYSFLHPGWIGRIVQMLLRLALRNAKTVVFENKDDLEWMLAAGLAKQTQAELIPGSGIDLEHFQPQVCEQTPHPTPHPTANPIANPIAIVFTFIGRLLYDKGLREFARAASAVKQQYPNAVFRIAGPIDEANPAHIREKELLDWVRSGAVQYKGILEDVRPLIACSDWIVLPSYREGLSRVLLEAMAMEKPLITTDTPGCRETVEPGKNGFLALVGDAEALAETMLRCILLPLETRLQMGRYSREKAALEFDSERVNARFLSILRQFIS